MIRIYPMRPIAAPRQSRRDAFKPSAPVQRYHAMRDEVRIRHVQIPQPFYHVVFVLAMPQGWSIKKRNEQLGMPHQQKPDKDNLEKALLDSCFGSDCHVWDGRASKVWGHTDLIVISDQPIPMVVPLDVRAWADAAKGPYTHAELP